MSVKDSGTNVRFWVTYKLTFAALIVCTVVGKGFIQLLQGKLVLGTFFAFFTVQSNLLGAAALFLSGAEKAGWSKLRITKQFRGAATVYLVTTGIVFAVLIAGLRNVVSADLLSKAVVLHDIFPLAILIDWILDPPENRLRPSTVFLWVIYPLVWLACTLIRGTYTNWYPYKFLNPATSGYGGITKDCLGITLFILLLSWVIVLVGNRKRIQINTHLS